jgi:hypothetical protein
VAVDEVTATKPIYFLHVPKAAGTSTRLMLVNGFTAAETLAPYNGSFYYAFQLASHPEIHSRYAYANGHFGLELPALVADRSWRIVTVCREPLERLLSFFDYLRQHRRLDREVDFRTWFEREIVPNDLAIAYFAPGMRHVEAKGAVAMPRVQESFVSAAVGNLARCEVVGLQERLEDTVNLLCATLDRLPPIRMGRANVTLHRTRRDHLDAATISWCEAHLGPEREFYAQAAATFERQHAGLREQLEEEAGGPLDTDAMRAHLRRRYFERRSAELAGCGCAASVHWHPDDAFMGFNLHDRERHAGGVLRWTGPAEETVFHAAVDTSRGMRIEIALHPRRRHHMPKRPAWSSTVRRWRSSAADPTRALCSRRRSGRPLRPRRVACSPSSGSAPRRPAGWGSFVIWASHFAAS